MQNLNAHLNAPGQSECGALHSLFAEQKQLHRASANSTHSMIMLIPYDGTIMIDLPIHPALERPFFTRGEILVATGYKVTKKLILQSETMRKQEP